MKTYKIENNELHIRFGSGDFTASLRVVKHLQGAKFHPQEKEWTAEANHNNITKLRFAGFDSLDLSPPEKQPDILVQRERQFKDIDISLLHKDIYPYQIDAVKFIEALSGVAIVGDDMGIGKSFEALSYCMIHKELQYILIACPATLKLTWRKEIIKWFNESSCVLSGTTPYQYEKTRFTIINYDILSYWQDYLLHEKFDLVIADEVQYVNNSTTQRTKSFIEIARLIPKRILLSGTPIKNRPKEFFTALNLVDPINFPNRYKYLHEYCGPKYNGFGWTYNGATNLEKLHSLVYPIMIRRTKEEVLKDLPTKIRIVVPFEMAENEKKEYANASEKFIEWVNSTKQKTMVDKKKNVELLKQIAYQGKRDYAILWIKEFLETTDQKLICFVHHKMVIIDLQEVFGKIAVTISGDTPVNKRQGLVDAFQNNTDIRLFIGQIQAAGVGITLTASSTVVFLEFPWTSSDVIQAEDRALRIGQRNNVSVYFLIAENTIEEDIVLIIEEKARILSKVLDGKQADSFLPEDIVDGILNKYNKELQHG